MEIAIKSFKLGHACAPVHARGRPTSSAIRGQRFVAGLPHRPHNGTLHLPGAPKHCG
jgi:hypothetical protein